MAPRGQRGTLIPTFWTYSNTVSNGYKTSPEMMGDSWLGGAGNCAWTCFPTVYSTHNCGLPAILTEQEKWVTGRDEKDWDIHLISDCCLLPNGFKGLRPDRRTYQYTLLRQVEAVFFSQRKVEFSFWYCEIDIRRGGNNLFQDAG